MNKSIINYGDSYKYSHSKQYPANMVSMYNYMEARGGEYPSTVFLGLQYYIRKYLTVPVTKAEVLYIQTKCKAHGVPFDFNGWMYIADKLNGKLPICIKAIPEGSLIPTGLPLMTIESTDTRVPWIAGFVETLLMKVWYPSTIATKSYYVKQMLERYGSPKWAMFAYHNFGDRGSTSPESAAIGGFAHYTQFMGTDNFDSLDIASDYYHYDDMPAFSVFATEHSSTTSWERDNEEEFVYQQLLANPDAPIMSFVADSYDVYEFTHFCTDRDSRIRKLIESRPHQKFILRPDSGEPQEVITRMLSIMKSNDLTCTFTAENNGITLFTDFGILWGDGITPKTIESIIGIQLTNGYAAENFVFGSGGDLMQNVSRDTQGFAIKCSSISIFNDDEEGTPRDIDVYKDPITSPGKKSKKGKVTTYINDATGDYVLGLADNQPDGHSRALRTVFLNGISTREYSLNEIKQRIT